MTALEAAAALRQRDHAFVSDHETPEADLAFVGPIVADALRHRLTVIGLALAEYSDCDTEAEAVDAAHGAIREACAILDALDGGVFRRVAASEADAPPSTERSAT